MRLIDADAIYQWYTDTFDFSPNEIRFSMYDIRDNLYNIPTVLNLPSAQSEQKKGKWIKKKSMIYCPNCYNGFEAIFIRDYNFCPYCGADMRGEQEGERK